MPYSQASKHASYSSVGSEVSLELGNLLNMLNSRF